MKQYANLFAQGPRGDHNPLSPIHFRHDHQIIVYSVEHATRWRWLLLCEELLLDLRQVGICSLRGPELSIKVSLYPPFLEHWSH